MILIKRVYDPPGPEDGIRFLVDRLWPRGIRKDVLKLDDWLKDVAPSDDLRHWYGHEPSKWMEFQERYFAELDGKPDTWQQILSAARQRNITLLYSSRETNYNNAVALKNYLEKHMKPGA
jgi:uncharacterized protein YeaO (DUF488 family)